MTKVDERGQVKDGEILSVQPAAEQVTNQAELAGGMTLAGRYAITDGMKLSELIQQPGAIGNSPDTTFGVISRRDATSYIRRLIAFTPTAVLRGTENMPLQTGDVVRVFSTAEAQMLRDSMKRFRQYKALARNAARESPRAVDDAANKLGFAAVRLGIPESAWIFASRYGHQSACWKCHGHRHAPHPAGFGSYTFAVPDNDRSERNVVWCLPLTDLLERNGHRLSRSGLRQRCSNQSELSELSEWNVELFDLGQQWKHQSGHDLPGQRKPRNLKFPAQLSGRTNGNPISPFSAYQNMQSGTLAMPGAPSPSVPQGVLSNVPPGNLEEQNISGSQVPTNEEAVTFVQAARQLSVEPTIFANFLLDHSVVLSGAVRGPGLYFAGPDLTLGTLIDAAGGPSSWADGSAVDVISTSLNQKTGTAATAHGTVALERVASYVVRPHDEFHVHEAYSDADFGSVTLQGEVRSAGDYQITRGRTTFRSFWREPVG